MKRGQNGFTLVESLLVFSVFLIISAVTAFSLKPQYFLENDNVFITQLEADLLYGQQFAISHQCEVFVRLTETEGYSIYYRYDLPPLLIRSYPENLKIYAGTLPLSFKFLPDGNVAQFGSIEINSCCKKYRLTILIGKGRFYVVEE
jgi:competence protein ComGD